jgi:hypothetical protein
LQWEAPAVLESTRFSTEFLSSSFCNNFVAGGFQVPLDRPLGDDEPQPACADDLDADLGWSFDRRFL